MTAFVRVAYSLDALLAQLNAKFPNRSKVSDGALGDAAHAATVSDHNPDAMGIVRARDFTHDPVNGIDGNWLANTLVSNRDSRIKYIIWNRRILDSRPEFNPWVWMPYDGSNPHDHHVHLSVMPGLEGDSGRDWNLSSSNSVPSTQGIDMALEAHSFDPTVDTAGKLYRRKLVVVVPTVSGSIFGKSWLSVKSGWGPIEYLRVYAVRSGVPADQTYAVDKTWTNVKGDSERIIVEAPDGVDSYSVEIASASPFGITVEAKPR